MPVFVDTNVLVYARDASDTVKQERAIAWLERLWRTQQGRLSFQVLHEFYVTVTRKLVPGLAVEAARSDVRDLDSWRPIALDIVVLEQAWVMQDRFQLSFWDALILATARVGGCDGLLTEDLQDGRSFAGVRVINPFTNDP